jgi:hypothetical protein
VVAEAFVEVPFAEEGSEEAFAEEGFAEDHFADEAGRPIVAGEAADTQVSPVRTAITPSVPSMRFNRSAER